MTNKNNSYIVIRTRNRRVILEKVKREKIESFRRICRDRHLSMTPQRMAIYEVLMNAQDHPSAEDVLERVRKTFPDIAIDTVYRTLMTFSEMNLIHVVEGYGEARRYDPDTDSHHHFRCRRCSRIIDFQETAFDHLKIPQTLKKKYAISNVKVVLEGVCDQCLRAKR